MSWVLAIIAGLAIGWYCTEAWYLRKARQRVEWTPAARIAKAYMDGYKQGIQDAEQDHDRTL